MFHSPTEFSNFNRNENLHGVYKLEMCLPGNWVSCFLVCSKNMWELIEISLKCIINYFVILMLRLLCFIIVFDLLIKYLMTHANNRVSMHIMKYWLMSKLFDSFQSLNDSIQNAKANWLYSSQVWIYSNVVGLF